MSRSFYGRAATAFAALLAAAVVVLPGSASVHQSVDDSSVKQVAQKVPEPARVPAKYVALGSSYAAGPDGPSVSDRCLRTSDNYPHQVADALGMTLVDATCSGATTANILDVPQRLTRQPQIDAVTPDAALVTITTGGNDIGYIQRLNAMSCGNVVPELARKIAARACSVGRHWSPEPSLQDYAEAEATMVATVAAVRMRAPHAKVLLVDYPPVVVAGGPACALLPLQPVQIEETIRMFDGLATITARAAQLSGAQLVTASRAGASHTVCSAHPWLLGFELPIAYHPNALGKSAVADLVVAALR